MNFCFFLLLSFFSLIVSLIVPLFCIFFLFSLIFSILPFFFLIIPLFLFSSSLPHSPLSNSKRFSRFLAFFYRRFIPSFLLTSALLYPIQYPQDQQYSFRPIDLSFAALFLKLFCRVSFFRHDHQRSNIHHHPILYFCLFEYLFS